MEQAVRSERLLRRETLDETTKGRGVLAQTRMGRDGTAEGPQIPVPKPGSHLHVVQRPS